MFGLGFGGRASCTCLSLSLLPLAVVLCFDRGMNLSSQLERTEGKGNSLNPTGGKYNSLGLLNSSMTVTAIGEMALASWELTLCHL